MSTHSTYPKFMSVFAAQYSLSSRVCIVISHGCDINEQSRGGIDPSCINHIQLVRLLPIDVMRIDFQHIISSFRNSWRLIMENTHVVIRGEEVH